MATVDWTFYLMNAVPGKLQAFLDSALAKVFPSSSADGFQSVASEDSPNLPESLRIQWSNSEERLVLGQRALLVRFHVKILLWLIIFTMFTADRHVACKALFIVIHPSLFFVVISSIQLYILLICSYTSFASWLIITDKSITVATPSWRYRWLIHLNLLIPALSSLLCPPQSKYIITKYHGRHITKIDTPTYADGSCKILIDYKAGIHMMQDAIIMDHFAGASSIRDALSRLDSERSNPDLERGELPDHIRDEIADQFETPRARDHTD